MVLRHEATGSTCMPTKNVLDSMASSARFRPPDAPAATATCCCCRCCCRIAKRSGSRGAMPSWTWRSSGLAVTPAPSMRTRTAPPAANPYPMEKVSPSQSFDVWAPSSSPLSFFLLAFGGNGRAGRMHARGRYQAVRGVKGAVKVMGGEGNDGVA